MLALLTSCTVSAGGSGTDSSAGGLRDVFGADETEQHGRNTSA